MTRDSDSGERIAKVMARAGLCSRRAAEAWIAAGRVAVNGAIITSPALDVTARDRITVDGNPLPRRERTRLFLYYKPVGLVSTNADPQGRPTVFDALPKGLPRLVSVGRLDIASEGLLLLTNDGGLARVLELPETAWQRRYRVRAHGRVTQGALDALRDGVTVDGLHYGSIAAVLEREQGSNLWLTMVIREGKNREVRNVLAHLGLQVNRLIRVMFGPFELGELDEGGILEVDMPRLRRELGPQIADRAGCDFAGPAGQPLRPEPRPHRREVKRFERGAARRYGEGGERHLGEHNERHGGERRDKRFDEFGERRGDKRFEKPGRPRRGHARRQDDAPLRRTYRGSRREDLQVGDRPEKPAGLLTDRKGRRIPVERLGTKAEAAEVPERTRKRRRPPPDRSAGPRPSRPKTRSERSAPAPSSPRSRGPRTRSSRNGPPRNRPSRTPPRRER